MRPTMVMAVTAIVGAATMLTVPRAGADDVAPQPGSPCAESLADALTQLPDRAFLVCSGGSWESFTGPYPSSDRWFSYGPPLTLHGQGLRNPEILSGNWTATPQHSDSTCSAQQAAVISAGEVGPPRTSTGEQGRPLDFDVLPVVFSIELTGDCLWERVS
jgi:hypothetical protein